MKCNKCNKEIEGELKYLAYYAGNKPVYWKICDSCMQKRWLDYKREMKAK